MITCSTTETSSDKPLRFEYIKNAGITYIFYDTKYTDFLHEKLNIVISNDAISEFKNDYELLNILYTKELEHIFDSSETDEVTNKCMEMFDMINASSLSKCLDLLTTKPTTLPMMMCEGGTSSNSLDEVANRRNVLPLLFSYDLLFFTHRCICDLLVSGEIKPMYLDTLCDAIHEYI